MHLPARRPDCPGHRVAGDVGDAKVSARHACPLTVVGHRAAGLAGDRRGLGISARVARGADESGGCLAQRMKPRHAITLLAEVRRELARWRSTHGGAQTALRAHLAGRVGRRVLHHRGHDRDARAQRATSRREISQLGATPSRSRNGRAFISEARTEFEKYWRRKNITLAQGQRSQEKATLAASVGIEDDFLGRRSSRRAIGASRPHRANVAAKPPAVFRPGTGSRGRPRLDGPATWTTPAMFACSADGLAKIVFPFGSPVGERIKDQRHQLHRHRRAGIQRRQAWAASRIISPSCPSPPG